MPKRSSKREDANQAAFRILKEATGEAPKTDRMKLDDAGKNPAAVALGRLGGLKGGAARKAALSPAKRKAIAKAAARARWGKSGS